MEDAIVTRLGFICGNEGLTCNEDVLKVVCKVSGGDMRKAITYVQGATRLCGEGDAVTEQDILNMAGAVPTDAVKGLLDTLRSDQYEQMEAAIDDLSLSAYPVNAILSQLLELIVQDQSSQTS